MRRVCISGKSTKKITDDVVYAWYSADFSRAIKGKEYDFLYEKDVVENEVNKSFIGSFDALKKLPSTITTMPMASRGRDLTPS